MVRLGTVQPGAKVPFKVDFKNRHRDPLEISWLNLGPDLTVEKFTREEIFDDEMGQIELVLTVPADAHPGHLERSITVNTSTGHEPMIIKLNATVAPTVAQVPASGEPQ